MDQPTTTTTPACRHPLLPIAGSHDSHATHLGGMYFVGTRLENRSAPHVRLASQRRRHVIVGGKPPEAHHALVDGVGRQLQYLSALLELSRGRSVSTPGRSTSYQQETSATEPRHSIRLAETHSAGTIGVAYCLAPPTTTCLANL